MTTTVASYHPRLPELQQDPHPYYHVLRKADPVHWSPLAQIWVLTRHADIVAVLRDGRFSAAARFQSALGALPAEARCELATVASVMSVTLAYLDLPEHTRMRRLVNGAFQPRVVEGLRPRIQAVIDQLLDRVQSRGRMDIMADFASPLRLLVSAEMLCLPEADIEQLGAWVAEYQATSSGEMLAEPSGRQRLECAIGQLTAYFGRVLGERRQRPGSDLISALLLARHEEDRLDNQELAAACLMLFIGGNMSTRAMLSLGILNLLRHPDQLDILRSEPECIAAAVEELLRFDSLNEGLVRYVTEAVVIDGRTIAAGERVLLLLTAANRDPARFTDPDRLDLRRNPNQHIAFGAGIHFCTGVPLGRLVLQTALSTLIQRMPDLKLATNQITWKDGLRARGLASLPVTF